MALTIEKNEDKILIRSSHQPSVLSSRVLPVATYALLLLGLLALGWTAWQLYQHPADVEAWGLPLGLELAATACALLIAPKADSFTENLITLDRNKGILSYGQQGYRGELEAPLAYVEELTLLQDRSAPEVLYQLFLIWENRAMWWLWEGSDPVETEKVARLLSDYLNLPLRDLTDLKLDQAGASEFVEANPQSTLKTSVFYEEARLHGTLSLGLRYHRNWPRRIAALLLVLGPGLALGLWSWRQWENGDNQASFWLTGATLVLASLILAVMIFWSEKRYQLFLKAAGLNIVLNFSNRLLNLMLQRKVTIPERAVQEIRLHRLPRGYFRLSVGLDQDFQPPVARNPFFNAGIFRRKPFQVSQADLHEVNIWEVAPHHDPKNGPYLGDLVALQTALHRQYLTRNGVRIQLYNER